MADAHGDNDLRRLEREAEQARARLHETIAEIKDPRTVENAKLEMKHRAEEMKDQIVDYIKGARDNALETGRSQSNEFVRKLQRTAIENPMSVALIGAGIGWHLYKKPPITTALIGAGLYQLMKNWDGAADERVWRDPYNRVAPRGYVPGGVAGLGYEEPADIAGVTDRVKSAATNLTYEAQNAVAGVQDAITGAASRVREAVGAGVDQARGAMDQARGAMDQARGAVAQGGDQLTDTGASMADRASAQYGEAAGRMRDMRDDAQDRLQGAARNAQDMAQGMAQDAQRRMRDIADAAQERLQPALDRISPWLDSERRSQIGMVLVMGGVGVLAGGLLRGSETGRRWSNEAGARLRDNWNDVADRSRDMASDATQGWRDTMRDTVRNVSDSLPRQLPVDEWRERASQAAASVSEQASALGRSAMDAAGSLRQRADLQRAQDMASEHPLLLSAIGLAIGAVLGGMIRQTPFERETFGSMAENLRDGAMDTLQENMGQMADRAGSVAQAVVGAVTGSDKDDPAKQAQAQRDRVNA